MNVDNNIPIIDVGFSETASLNMLIFCRIIQLNQFNFTSGAAMLFPEEYKDYLLRKSKKNAKKLNVEDNSMKRFISYFHLHRTDGLTIFFEDVVK